MPAYARTIERFLDDACIEGGKAGLHQCHVRKVAAALHIHLIDQFYLVGQAQALAGRAAIGAYQTARPQLDSTEPAQHRSEAHTSELQSLMRHSYAVFCLKKKTQQTTRI